MPKIKLYNMIMICRGSEVLVLDRAASDWPGLTFPGGHVEPGESFTASAIREAKEETGLDVKNVEPCGVVHWASPDGDRYIEFLYKTTDFSGETLDGTDEGRIFWMERAELEKSDRLSPNFEHYLPVFFGDGFTEAFFEWDGKSFDGVPKYL